MGKRTYTYDGSEWVGLTSTTADLSNYANLTTYQPTFRNLLINGGFSIDQRNNGSSQGITKDAALAYTVDRWYAYCTGGSISGSRIAGSAPSQHYYRFTGDASNTAVGFGQRIEAANSFHLAGKVVNLSVNIASTSLTSVTWTAFYANTTDTFGTLASPTRTQIATGTFAVTSTLSRKSVNISIPSAAITGIEIVFTTGALLGSQTLTFDDAQLELGTIATPFEQRPIGTELALCQRYYWRWNTNGNQYAYYSMCLMRTGTGFVLGTGPKHPVTMRAVPSVSLSSMFGEVPSGGGKALNNGPITNNLSTVENVGFVITADSNWGASEPGLIRAYNTTAAYVEHGAEL